jgi:parallel beta helix pectate lyase-like protein
MMNPRSKVSRRKTRWIALPILMTLAFVGMNVGTNDVAANHPVLVEGNCDSPVPGTTLVSPGTCGDFDGDGRIGTAEDTDGADRIFGTLAAAIGPGTGAAAGTGANGNGAVLIVASGRFAESLRLSNAPFAPNGDLNLTGNLTISAAPGVHAILDAVLQGDPAGLNNTRQATSGIYVSMNANAAERMVVIRNLTIRNFLEGVTVAIGSGRVHIDRCTFEGNLENGVHVMGNDSQVVITNSQFDGQGRRIGTATQVTPTPGNGNGIRMDNACKLKIGNTTIWNSVGAGIVNTDGVATAVLYQVQTYFNNPNLLGPGITIAPDHNFSQ